MHDPGGKSRLPWPSDSVIEAEFSQNGMYRWRLSETWTPGRAKVMFLLMNPSVADVVYADPTLRRTGNFARSWGYGGQLIGNVAGFRITNSKALTRIPHAIGLDNHRHIMAMQGEADIVVLGFGSLPPKLRSWAQALVAELAGIRTLYALRVGAAGDPYHPLYLPASLRPQIFNVKRFLES
jgi:hypothetical protein